MNAAGEPGGLLVVGDYPGAYEDALGEAWTGEAGKYLRELLARWWSGPLALDNAVRCRPRGEVPGTAVDRCRPYLVQTVHEVRPQRIICLGGHAATSMLHESVPVLSARRGYTWFWNDGRPVPVFVLMNPVNALRNMFLREWFESDLKWALTTPEERLSKRPVDGRVRIVADHDDARQVAKEILTAGGFTYDTEHAGRVHDRYLKLLCVGTVAYGSESVAIWSARALENAAVADELRSCFSDRRVRVSGQFLKHDLNVVGQALGVTVRGTDVDVRLQRKLLESHASGRLEHMGYLVGLGGHKLEMQTALRAAAASVASARQDARRGQLALPTLRNPILDEAAKTHLPSASYSYGLVDEALLFRYCALDVLATERLRLELGRRIERQGNLKNIWSKVVRGTTDAVAQMERWGVPVSRAAVENYRRYLREQIDTTHARISAYGIDPESTAQVRELLFEKLHLSSAVETATGVKSTNKDVLKSLRGKHPIIEDLLRYRKFSKLSGTYAEGLLEHIREDGRIHPNFDAAGARTGRSSTSEPNLQNLPRGEDELTAISRNCFVADPGRRIISIDYNQLEIRSSAMLSQDSRMIELLKTGRDFHRATAESIAPRFWGIPIEQVNGYHRTACKTLNFANLYGQGAASSAKRIGCSVEDAAAIQAAILSDFPALRDYIQECIRDAMETGYTWTWWDGQPGRIRSLYPIANTSNDDKSQLARSRAKNGAFNTRAQGLASEFCIASLVQVVNWLILDNVDCKLVLAVHDELLFDSAEEEVDRVCKTVPEIMVAWNTAGVPLKVDVEVGPSWGNLKKYAEAA